MDLRKRASINWKSISSFLTNSDPKISDPQIQPPARQTLVFLAPHHSKSATVWSPKAEHPPKLRTALHNTDMQHWQKIQHALVCSLVVFLNWNKNIKPKLQSRWTWDYTSHLRWWKKEVTIFQSSGFNLKLKAGALNLFCLLLFLGGGFASNQDIHRPVPLTCKLVIRSVQLPGVRQALVTVLRLHFPRARRNAELFGDPRVRWQQRLCRCPSRRLETLLLNHLWSVVNKDNTPCGARWNVSASWFVCVRPRARGAEWARHSRAGCHAHVRAHTHVHTRWRSKEGRQVFFK